MEIKDSVHLEKGTSPDVAAVFSCPGKKERDARPLPRPAAGQTGTNLKDLLGILGKRGIGFPSLRSEITVTNAWPKVEFKAKTGRTEASLVEILKKDNLVRLARELEVIERFIVCFGDRAAVAVARLLAMGCLKPGCKVLFAPHLGLQSLNKSISVDVRRQPIIAGGGHANTIRRLEVVAKLIEDQLTQWGDCTER